MLKPSTHGPSEGERVVTTSALPMLQAGGFSAGVNAYTWQPHPHPSARRMLPGFMSMLGSQQAVKALSAQLVKGRTALLSFRLVGRAQVCSLAPEGRHRWRFLTAHLQAAFGHQGVLLPEAGFYAAERSDFLLLPRRPEEALRLHYRFILVGSIGCWSGRFEREKRSSWNH